MAEQYSIHEFIEQLAIIHNLIIVESADGKYRITTGDAAGITLFLFYPLILSVILSPQKHDIFPQ